MSSVVSLLRGMLVLCSTLAGLVACGGGSDGQPTPMANNEIASVSITDGNQQAATVATELPRPLVAVLLNSAGQPVSGKSVNFVATTGSGSVFAGTAVSDTSGVVRERWTLGTKTGAQRVELRGIDATGTARAYASFDATATAAAPKSIAALTGNAQTGAQSSALATPVRVRVTDEYANLVPGAVISFSASDGGSTNPPSAATNAQGEAETVWTLGSRIGTQSLVASASATLSTSVVANVTSSAPRVSKVAGDAQTVSQYGFTTQPLSVRVTQPDGSVCVSCEVTFTKTTTSGTRVPVVRTDSSGVATLPAGFTRSSFSEPNVVGLYFTSRGQEQVTATAAGLGSVTFTVNVAANPRVHDGVYLCPSPGFGFNMIVVGSVITTAGGYIGSQGAGSLNTSDGTLTGIAYPYTPNTPFGINLTGRITVGADQQASASGNYTVDAVFGVAPGTWSCTRA